MTGNAQNQLGQLFVDIGLGGVGTLLKSLNTVSASFLLVKTAATQAVKPIVDMTRFAQEGALGVSKLAASLGTTSIKAQQLKYYLQTLGAEGLEGSVMSLQDMFTRLRLGYGGLEGQKAMSMNALGLDWTSYSGSYDDTIKFIKDVQNALKQKNLSKQEQLMHLNNLGLSDWMYLFEQDSFSPDKMDKFISEEEIRKLNESERKRREKEVSKEIAKQRTSNITNKSFGDKFTDWQEEHFNDYNAIIGEDEEKRKQALDKWQKEAKPILDNILMSSPVFIPYKTLEYSSSLFPNAAIPPGAQTSSETKVNNYVNIKTDSPEETKNKIEQISADSIEQARFNKYETQNQSDL